MLSCSRRDISLLIGGLLYIIIFTQQSDVVHTSFMHVQVNGSKDHINSNPFLILLLLGVRIRIMLVTFLRDITATFLSVTDMYIRTYVHTYAHHENRSRIRKLAICSQLVNFICAVFVIKKN